MRLRCTKKVVVAWPSSQVVRIVPPLVLLLALSLHSVLPMVPPQGLTRPRDSRNCKMLRKRRCFRSWKSLVRLAAHPLA